MSVVCLSVHKRRLPQGNDGDCPRRKTPHRAPPCEELDPPCDIKLVFVQKITFVLRKINKNCCHHICTFDSNIMQHQIICRWGWASPQLPSCFRGLTFKVRGDKEIRGRKRERRSGQERKERRGSLSFAIEGKKKSQRLCVCLSVCLSVCRSQRYVV